MVVKNQFSAVFTLVSDSFFFLSKFEGGSDYDFGALHFLYFLKKNKKTPPLVEGSDTFVNGTTITRERERERERERPGGEKCGFIDTIPSHFSSPKPPPPFLIPPPFHHCYIRPFLVY